MKCIEYIIYLLFIADSNQKNMFIFCAIVALIRVLNLIETPTLSALEVTIVKGLAIN